MGRGGSTASNHQNRELNQLFATDIFKFEESPSAYADVISKFPNKIGQLVLLGSTYCYAYT